MKANGIINHRIRPARLEDAPAMAKVMVDTYLACGSARSKADDLVGCVFRHKHNGIACSFQLLPPEIFTLRARE